MKRRIIWPFLLTIPLLLILAGMLYFQFHYILWNDRIYPRDLETLDLSGETLSDLKKLAEFTELTDLNLSNTGLTFDQYDQITQLLPHCRILWHVPFQGGYLASDTEALTLRSCSHQDIPALQYLQNLQSITLIDFTDAEIIEALITALPNCDILPQCTLGGKPVDYDVRFYKSSSIKAITDALEKLSQITLLDATDCPNFTTLAALQTQYPDCKILYRVPFGGTHWRECTTDITVESATGEELSKALAALPLVKSVRITQPVPDPDILLRLRQDYPHIAFDYCFDLFGKTVTPQTETIDLSGISIRSAADIDAYIPHFDQLKTVDMCDCGVSNAEMDALQQRYPDIKFVWKVQIGHAWIRTDVTYFMPYQHRLVLYDHHVDNLKYLTDLICLDMGHMKVTRTDYLDYMPKLQYLLMCGTPITDISACAMMKDLKYVELFITEIKDFSPLLECKNLVDLNVCYTNPKDPLIFGQMTQLENLWFRGMSDQYVIAQLRQALPNTNMLFGPGSSTGRGWRRLPNYYAQRDILHMPYMEEP